MGIPLFLLKGKASLVEGDSQGIGESTAKLLARADCGVADAEVIKERADRVANVVATSGNPLPRSWASNSMTSRPRP